MMVASGNTGEILNANTNTWANIGNNAPGSHGFGATASQLTTGVLVIGGWGAGIHFDLLRNSPMTWAPDGTVPWDGWDTRGHSATQVGTGAILKVGGGENDYPGHWVTNAASLYYTSSNEWTAMPYAAYPRSSHTGTLLPTWKILIAGGWNYSTPPTYSEVFDYATELWVPSLQATMVNPRYGHTAALLDSGQVLVTGGRLNSNGQVTATAELYAEPAQ
jgi:hypothetical protein